MEVKGSLGSSTIRRRRNLNKESSRIREEAQGQVIPLWPFRRLEKECSVYLKKKGKHKSFSHCWVFSGGFHYLRWIDDYYSKHAIL